MNHEVLVDGRTFVFHGDWIVAKVDEWAPYRTLTANPINAKACDLVAVNGLALYLIEAKDYTYPESSGPPADLAASVGRKAFDTMALLFALRRLGEGEQRDVSRAAAACTSITVCLNIELKDGGQGAMTVEKPLADLLQQLRKGSKHFSNRRPIISSHQRPAPLWSTQRDPSTRERHADR